MDAVTGQRRIKPTRDPQAIVEIAVEIENQLERSARFRFVLQRLDSARRRDFSRGAMKAVASRTLALCSFVAMLAPEFALADPRDIAGPPEPQTAEMLEAKREQKTHDMAEWLPSLVGRYRLEGQEVMITNRPPNPAKPPPPPKFVRGKADCVLVGSGPGVQCVIHVEWDRSTDWSSAWLSSNSPTVILYGLDPLAGKIRYLQVDHSSIAQQGEAVLTGTTLYFQEHPVNQRRLDVRRRRFQLTAPAGNAPIKLSAEYPLVEGGVVWVALRVDMVLERIPQDAGD